VLRYEMIRYFPPQEEFGYVTLECMSLHLEKWVFKLPPSPQLLTRNTQR
jgi:hypothetical protein